MRVPKVAMVGAGGYARDIEDSVAMHAAPVAAACA